MRPLKTWEGRTGGLNPGRVQLRSIFLSSQPQVKSRWKLSTETEQNGRKGSVVNAHSESSWRRVCRSRASGQAWRDAWRVSSCILNIDEGSRRSAAARRRERALTW